jgi:hypothetical protein
MVFTPGSKLVPVTKVNGKVERGMAMVSGQKDRVLILELGN